MTRAPAAAPGTRPPDEDDLPLMDLSDAIQPLEPADDPAAPGWIVDWDGEAPSGGGEPLLHELPPQAWTEALASVLQELGCGPEALTPVVLQVDAAGAIGVSRKSDQRRARLRPRRPEIDLTAAMIEEPVEVELPSAAIAPVPGADAPETGAWHRVRSSAAALVALERALVELESVVDPMEACGRCLDLTLAAVPAESAAVLLHRSVLGAFSFVAARGPMAQAVLGLSLPEDAGIAGLVRRTGAALLLRDARSHALHDRRVEHLTGYATRGMLAVPILVEGRAFGVIEVLNPFGGGALLSWHQSAVIAAAEALAQRLLR